MYIIIVYYSLCDCYNLILIKFIYLKYVFIDNYKTAQQKANKARNTNNLSSNNEELKQKYRRNKKKNGRHSNKSDSEYELSTETEISSSDDVRYPNIPNEQIDSSDSK